MLDFADIFFENHVRKDYWNNHTQIYQSAQLHLRDRLARLWTAELWTALLRHM